MKSNLLHDSRDVYEEPVKTAEQLEAEKKRLEQLLRKTESEAVKSEIAKRSNGGYAQDLARMSSYLKYGIAAGAAWYVYKKWIK